LKLAVSHLAGPLRGMTIGQDYSQVNTSSLSYDLISFANRLLTQS
jgi:hypothetical protein